MEVKKCIWLIFIIICIFFYGSSTTLSARPTFDVDIYRPKIEIIEGIEQANEELSNILPMNQYFEYFTYVNELGVTTEVGSSKNIWSEYGILSSESYSGNSKFVKELEIYPSIQNYQYEFIGKSNLDDSVPNPYYPVDSYPSSEIMGRWIWVENPENYILNGSRLISGSSSNYKNALSPSDQDEFVNQLINGLEDDYSDMFDEAAARAEGTEAWIRRAGVVIPPTKISRGVVRLWHTGGAWYTNVIMNPLYHFQPEFRIEFNGLDYTDDRLVTMNVSEVIDVINDTNLGENDVTESISWYVDGILHSEDPTPYSKGTIQNSRIQLTISDTTEIKLVVKVKDNPEIKEITHEITLVKHSLAGLSATNMVGDLVIASNEPGNQIFDVAQGIPSNETLFVQVVTDEYIMDYDFVRRSGGNSYTATITGEYDNGDGTSTPFSEQRLVSRTYSYYDVDWYYLYEIAEANAYNYALSSSLDLLPSSSYKVSITHTSGGVNNMPRSESVDVGLVSRGYDFQRRANSLIGSYSTSDGVIILSDVASGLTTSSPKVTQRIYQNSSKPIPAKTDLILYDQVRIDPTIANNLNTPSSARVMYQLENEHNSGRSGNVEVNLTGNPVTVHTPVVCYPTLISEDTNGNGINDRIERTQQGSIDLSREQLIIGESFRVDYPLDGQHLSIQGYGDRDYSGFTLNRQIQFSFDVYRGIDDGGSLLRAGQWHDYVESGEDGVTVEESFYIPKWNMEMSKGSIVFRTIPINIQDLVSDGYAYKLNDSVSTYKAVEQIDIELSSSVYSFSITDVTDPDWDSHFVKGDFFESEDLPIMNGKHTELGYDEHAVKLGYEIKFNLMTNGMMTGRDDVMVITPTYYHLDENGNNRQKVDVYYESKNGFVALGSEQDTMSNPMVLNQLGRDMASGELHNTAFVLDEQERGSGYDASRYLEALSGDYEYNIKWEDKLLLSEMQKTYVGAMDVGSKPSYISDEKLLESQQRWYGEFYLPSQTVVVSHGTDLSQFGRLIADQAPFFQSGYIIVNFTVDAYHDIHNLADLSSTDPYISYDNYNNGHQRGNQWFIENYDLNQAGNPLMYGDVLFYHIDKRASDNYE